MANQTTGNPLVYDGTTGASWTGTRLVRLFQWVDLNEDIADGDMCSFKVNNTTLESEIQVTDNTANKSVVWEIGPFNPGIPWTDFSLTTLDGGAVHIWMG